MLKEPDLVAVSLGEGSSHGLVGCVDHDVRRRSPRYDVFGSRPWACSTRKCSASVVRRLLADPGTIGGTPNEGGREEGFSTPSGLRTSLSGALKSAKKRCAQCAHLGLRIRLYRPRTGPDWGCFRRVADFQGDRLVRDPPRAQCFPCSGAFWPLSVHILFTCGPLRGPFFIAGRWCGRVPPCLVPVLECLLFGTCSWQFGVGQHDL